MLVPNRLLPLTILLPLTLALGCADGEVDDSSRIGPDPAADGCDERAALPTEWRPIADISAGTIAPISAGRIHIDATAGGSFASSDSPFLYLSFADGEPRKVELTDVESFQRYDWDLAFKRFVVRVNGGDSGPGAAEVAPVADGNLANVTGAVDAEFVTDDFVDDNCDYVGGLIGEPVTALVDWYEYADMGLSPVERSYLFRRGDRTFKFRIHSYNYSATEATGDAANIEFEWAEL